MNVTKKIGRPKSFDEETALNAAVEVFWGKGYHGASIKDLTSAMGINSPSLYATYGDKETLFIKAIENYMYGGNCTPLDALDSEDKIRDAVRAFFEAIVNSPNGMRGCFLSSGVATCAETVEPVRALLQRAISETENRIKTRFEKAKQAKDLPSEFPSSERARLMFDLRQGLVFRARSGINKQMIQQDIDYWVSIVIDFG